MGSSFGARCMLGSIQSRRCPLTSASSWSAAVGVVAPDQQGRRSRRDWAGGPAFDGHAARSEASESQGSRAHPRRVAVATRPPRLGRERRGGRSRAGVGPAPVRPGELVIGSRASFVGARRKPDSVQPRRCNLISASGCAAGWRRVGPRRFSQSPRPGRPCFR
jgi:hypothetical protein